MNALYAPSPAASPSTAQLRSAPNAATRTASKTACNASAPASFDAFDAADTAFRDNALYFSSSSPITARRGRRRSAPTEDLLAFGGMVANRDAWN